MPSKSAQRAPYCLHCHAPVEEAFDASFRCVTCGKVNLRVDREMHWTLTPKARNERDWLRWIGTLTILVATLVLLGLDVRHHETGWKVYALMGSLIPIGLWWDLTSLRTRHVSRYRSEILLPAVLLVTNFAPACWALFTWLNRGQPDLPSAIRETVLLLLATIPMALGMRAWVHHMGRLRAEARLAPGVKAGETIQRASALAPRPERSPISRRAVHAIRKARGLMDAKPSSAYRSKNPERSGGRCLHCFATLKP